MHAEKSALARVAGLRELRTPQLEDIDRRRAQLWSLSLLASLVIPAAIVLIGLGLFPATWLEALDSQTLRLTLLALLVALLGYVAEREAALRRLGRLLVEERVLTANLKGRVEELDLLVTATRAMNSSLDLPIVLNVILEAACELLQAAEGSIQLVVSERTLEVAATRGETTALIGQRQNFDQGLGGQAARTREPLLVQGAQEASSVSRPIDSALVVPMELRGEVLGVLNLAGPAHGDFTEYELRSVAMFAETAAGAISNARSHAMTQERVAVLTELDRMKSDFLAMVTHEVRTPLSVIIGSASTLTNKLGTLDAEQIGQLCGIIMRQGWRLDHLVNQLLQAAAGERHAFGLEAREVDAGDIVVEALATFQPEDRSLSSSVPDGGVLLMCDSGALTQIVVNLVGNGLSHTPPGTAVRVELAPQEQGVMLVVEDDGPGIPEEQAERVFEKFVRGTSGRATGLGLGLYLVRMLAEAHGGAVTLDRSQAGGCRFVVTLRSLPEPPPARVGLA